MSQFWQKPIGVFEFGRANTGAGRFHERRKHESVMQQNITELLLAIARTRFDDQAKTPAKAWAGGISAGTASFSCASFNFQITAFIGIAVRKARRCLAHFGLLRRDCLWL